MKIPIEKKLEGIKFYRTATAYGICCAVDPYSPIATMIMNVLEPYINKCNMPRCDEPAVRVAVFSVEKPGEGKGEDSEFRGLCERHKTQGMWNNDGG